eukprot:COSAG06_NODE_6257_length_3011_cov_2.619849_2_plen_372_part_00
MATAAKALTALAAAAALLMGARDGSSASASAPGPNTCQPRQLEPLMPIFHILGNISGSGATLRAEPINDVSGIVLHRGVYHVFHQCCGNHWDHVVTHDLIHWTRLPPPLVPGYNPTGVQHSDWYDIGGSWDGSVTLLPADQSPTGKVLPLIIYDTIEGTPPPGGGRGGVRGRSLASVGDHPTLAVARAVDADDPYLLSWEKDAANPLVFQGCPNITGQGCGTYFPSGVWKNGDHWNFMSFGERFTTKDSTFHSWQLAPGPKFGPGSCCKTVAGGQWITRIPNQIDGTPPDATVAGNSLVSLSDGWQYILGTYDRETETWTPTIFNGTTNPPGVVNFGNGRDDDAVQWGVGQWAGDRMLNIYWGASATKTQH